MSESSDRRLGLASSVAVVVASMVGAGIFTTTGTLAVSLATPITILLVWAVGGALALAAALSYGELGGMMPSIGAEVHYLRRVFGPWVGFQAGFVTFLAGFAVPVAAVASALGDHGQALTGLDARVGAVLSIALVTAIHGYGVRFGARVNDLTCVIKVLIVLVFVVAGLAVTPRAAAVSSAVATGEVFAPFAHGLVLVAFAYTGWNAAAYLGGEIKDPGRLLPRALLIGTGLVTVLYLLCNVVFLRAGSPDELAGVSAVGQFAADRLFGPRLGQVFSGLIALLLLSTLSSFVMAGPRVAVSMADDGEAPAFLGRRNRRGAPTAAAILLAICSLVFLFTASFEWLLGYVGVLLTLSAGLAVAGLLVLRKKAPEAPRPFRVPLYPWLPIAFVILSLWMLIEAAREGRSTVVGAAVTLVAGTLLRPVLQHAARRG